ncbi:MAG: putative dehydrogenase [Chloroflexi bacterium]|jgi:predicted dehydrogenase|nr:MAG: putative dehydrogenase [Chloroflexota bacterium]
MPDERVRIALVGCGNIARAHWRGIRYGAPLLEVTAVVDADADRAAAMAARTGGRAFTSLTEALAQGDFDAVDLMLPHDLHEAAVLEAFAAHKHVVLEKPMAPTLDACARILAAAEASGRVFMIAEQSQFWPDAMRIQELLAAGAIGDVIWARAFFFDPPESSGSVGNPADPIPWRFRLARSGGGISMDGGAHWIRPLRMWFGDVESVMATTGRHVAEMEGESRAHAVFRFSSGVTATFDALLGAGPGAPTEDFRITGTAGEIVAERGNGGRLLLYDAAHPQGEVLLDSFAGRSDAFGVELNEFSRAVLHGEPFTAGPEHSLGELRTALAMYRSAKSGRWEQVAHD